MKVKNLQRNSSCCPGHSFFRKITTFIPAYNKIYSNVMPLDVTTSPYTFNIFSNMAATRKFEAYNSGIIQCIYLKYSYYHEHLHIPYVWRLIYFHIKRKQDGNGNKCFIFHDSWWTITEKYVNFDVVEHCKYVYHFV